MTFENRSFEKRVNDESRRLKSMGWTFILFALITTITVFFLPSDETSYWLSIEGKRGFYTLSALFAFLGAFCLGAVWRRKNFI